MSKSKEQEKNPLLRIADEISDEHLVEIDAEVEATEKKLAGLRRLRSVAAAFLGKEEKRGKRQPKEPQAVAAPSAAASQASGSVPNKTAVSIDSIIAIAKVLRASAPLMVPRICELTKLSPPTVYGAMKHEWFDRRETGWALKPAAVEWLAKNT